MYEISLAYLHSTISASMHGASPRIHQETDHEILIDGRIGIIQLITEAPGGGAPAQIIMIEILAHEIGRLSHAPTARSGCRGRGLAVAVHLGTVHDDRIVDEGEGTVRHDNDER